MGCDYLDRVAFGILIDWKFAAMPHRRKNARSGLETEHD
jgi:hypothetical protein